MSDAESVTTISKAHEVDPVFAEVAELLYGDAVDVRELHDIAKMNDASEVHVNGGVKLARKCKTCKKAKCDCEVAKRMSEKRRRKLQAQVGLATNVIGIPAGAVALGSAFKDSRFSRESGGGKLAQKIYAAGQKLPEMTPKMGRRGAYVAGAALGLQAANVAGDTVANRVLAREAKKKVPEKTAVHKALDDILAARRSGRIDTETAIRLADQLVTKAHGGRHRMSYAQSVHRAELAEHALKDAPKAKRAALVGTGLVAATAGGAAGHALGRRSGKRSTERRLRIAPLPMTGPAPTGKHRSTETVEKAELVDYAFTGEISKMDEDKRLAFGWASLSTVDGEPVVDLQGDYAPIEEIEKSAYAYVVTSRVGGDMHARDGERPKHTSDLVESFIATPEKLEQMGLSAEVAKSVPVGWWVGFKVNDDEQWAMVKDGRRAGFSIHGKGSRVQKSLEAAKP